MLSVVTGDRSCPVQPVSHWSCYTPWEKCKYYILDIHALAGHLFMAGQSSSSPQKLIIFKVMCKLLFSVFSLVGWIFCHPLSCSFRHVVVLRASDIWWTSWLIHWGGEYSVSACSLVCGSPSCTISFTSSYLLTMWPRYGSLYLATNASSEHDGAICSNTDIHSPVICKPEVARTVANFYWRLSCALLWQVRPWNCLQATCSLTVGVTNTSRFICL